MNCASGGLNVPLPDPGTRNVVGGLLQDKPTLLQLAHSSTYIHQQPRERRKERRKEGGGRVSWVELKEGENDNFNQTHFCIQQQRAIRSRAFTPCCVQVVCVCGFDGGCGGGRGGGGV